MTVIIQGLDDDIMQLKADTESAIVGTVIEVEGLLRARTRVDTGNARNSWHTSRVADDYGVEGANQPNAADVMAQYSLGETIYVNNGAEYISYLENGTSRMAGDHMVRRTINDVPELLERQNADVRAARR